MISWIETKRKFNRVDCSGYRPVVVCECDGCGKQSDITIRVKSRVQHNQMAWYCQKCVGRRADVQEKLSRATTRSWTQKAYKEKQSEKSRELWDDANYREAISRSEKKYYNQPHIKRALHDKYSLLYADEDYKQKQRERSIIWWQDPEYREKMAVARSQQPRISSIQKVLYSILDDLGVEYEIEKPIGFYTFDCFIPSHNILIECQGEYWHSLKAAIRNDKAKSTYIERYFPQHQLQYLWEHEFSAKDKIINVIKYWLGLSKLVRTFKVGDVMIKSINHPTARRLLEKYHYLPNAGRGGMIYGAYLNDKLIACCVFSSPTRKETATRLGYQPKEVRELSRFCIHPSYQKKNFGSWFISRCLKELKALNKYKIVVSFCDTTYNHDGALYKASNFILDGKVKPDYWYVDEDGYVMHKKTLYQRAITMKMKEKEYAEKNGYMKVWGKEKLRFFRNLGKA